VHLWSYTPALCQIWIEPDHQVNDPNGPDGLAGTAAADDPNTLTFKTQFEPWIAAHPLELGVVFGAWNDFSHGEDLRSDGFGASNLATSDPPPWTHDLVVDMGLSSDRWSDAQADPGCAIGGNRMFYQSGIDWTGGTPFGVYFARSATGFGVAGWEVGFISGGEDSFDAPKVTAGRSADPLRMNRVYLVWAARDLFGRHSIMLSQDPNSGESWASGTGRQFYTLSDPTLPTYIKPAPVGDVGPGGEFYVAWFRKPGGFAVAAADIVFNGSYIPFPANWPGDPPVFFGPQTIVQGFDTIEAGHTDERTNFRDALASWPDIAVDTSGCQFTGNIYVVYVEETTGLSPNLVKVLVARPNPPGAPIWSPPVVVNHDVPAHSLQWMAAIDVDRKGRVGIMWHDTRESEPEVTVNQPFDVFFAFSLDGGATWSKNIRVSGDSSRPQRLIGSREHKVGEYNGMASSRESFNPMWMDLRRWSGNAADEAGDIFTTRIDVTAWADFDNDCDVDLTGDYTVFEACYSGDGNPFPPGCGNADFDADGDVDGADFLIFQKLLTGDGNCLCGGGASEEPFSDHARQTWYTRTDVRACLRNYCVSHVLPLP